MGAEGKSNKAEEDIVSNFSVARESLTEKTTFEQELTFVRELTIQMPWGSAVR